MGEKTGFIIKTVFWTLILGSFVFAAGSYAFTYAGQLKEEGFIKEMTTTLANAIVCNDRIRQQKDEDIVREVGGKIDKLQSDITDIKVSIARIK
jgi:hypothetical protein